MATPVREWKKSSKAGKLDLALPSGNVALVRRLQPEAFLASGLIPDTLSDMVHKAIKTKKGLPPDAQKQIAEDPKKLVQALQMMDEVVCYVVVEPEVKMPPKCGVIMSGERLCDEYVETEDKRHTDPNNPDHHVFMEDARDEDTLYADEVSLEDKNFIFQFSLGGTADLERFRQEQRTGVANLSNRKAVPGKAKRSPRRK
jgi:hypothetical protein